MKIQPVILAGGSGSRLWPVSREIYPKQLLKLTGSRSLLQTTLERVRRFENALPPVIVVGEEHRFVTRQQIDELELFEKYSILLEPLGRSTAPAICGTAEYVRLRRGEQTVVMVLPSDHLIGDEAKLAEAIREASALAVEGRIVTFGIPIERPETGYGYIQEGESGYVASFREKPGIEEIKGYMEEGNWYWNSGMFTFTAQTFQEEMVKFAPTMWESMVAAIENGENDGDFFRFDAHSMADVDDISIDYVLMEKTERASVVPVHMDWKDVGSWQSLWEIMDRDENDNVCRGDVIAESTDNSMIVAEDRLVAALGLSGMVVVETADAVLVAAMSEVQNVRSIVRYLKDTERQECRVHATMQRPWGSCTTLESRDRYRINRLRVNPAAGLSLQKHYHRYEHWIVVSGTAKITSGREVFLLQENESSSIPAGVLHRVENPGAIPLELIEIQIGSYIGEDDIVRYDNEYG